MVVEGGIKEEEEIKINNGITFCQVARRKHSGHLIELITEGNQKWKGAIPSFTISPVKIRG